METGSWRKRCSKSSKSNSDRCAAVSCEAILVLVGVVCSV
jgi:hypothetical protein